MIEGQTVSIYAWYQMVGHVVQCRYQFPHLCVQVFKLPVTVCQLRGHSTQTSTLQNAKKYMYMKVQSVSLAQSSVYLPCCYTRWRVITPKSKRNTSLVDCLPLLKSRQFFVKWNVWTSLQSFWGAMLCWLFNTVVSNSNNQFHMRLKCPFHHVICLGIYRTFINTTCGILSIELDLNRGVSPIGPIRRQDTK